MMNRRTFSASIMAGIGAAIIGPDKASVPAPYNVSSYLRLVDMGNSLPSRFKLDPDPNLRFHPGQIAAVQPDWQQPLLATVYRHGLTPVGIIDDVRNESGDSTIVSDTLTVWHTKGMIFETDAVEQNEQYRVRDILYPSTNGRFSKNRNMFPVGEVIAVRPTSDFWVSTTIQPRSYAKCLRIKWLYHVPDCLKPQSNWRLAWRLT